MHTIKVLFSWLTIFFTIFLLGFPNSLAQEQQHETIGSSKLIFISDTNHDNYKRLTSTFSKIITNIVNKDNRYNCVFLESDHVIFSPALRDYMSGQSLYENSVLKAQRAWEKVSGRNYIQAPREFLDFFKVLELKVYPVDWNDDSDLSRKMATMFKEGFAGNENKLREAFRIGIDVRNKHMAKNIANHMSKDCNKGIVIAGSLHMVNNIEMPTGFENYTSIGQFSPLDNLPQIMIEVVDCKDFERNKTNSEVERQCDALGYSPTLKTEFKSIYEGEDSFISGYTRPKNLDTDHMGGRPSPLIFERWVIK